jgi:hypothetical protein
MSKSNAPLDGKFNQLYSDVVTAKSSFGSAKINIYTDANGSEYAKDSNNNEIQNAIISYTMYTYGMDYSPSSNVEVGFVRIVFKGNSKLEIKNTTDPVYWYSFSSDSDSDSSGEIKPLQ